MPWKHEFCGSSTVAFLIGNLPILQSTLWKSLTFPFCFCYSFLPLQKPKIPRNKWSHNSNVATKCRWHCKLWGGTELKLHAAACEGLIASLGSPAGVPKSLGNSALVPVLPTEKKEHLCMELTGVVFFSRKLHMHRRRNSGGRGLGTWKTPGNTILQCTANCLKCKTWCWHNRSETASLSVS